MKHIIYLTITIIIVALTGCSSTPVQPQVTAESVSVEIQLSWTHEYSAAAFHAAVNNGHFTAQNLDVTLSQGGFNEQGYIDPIEEVLAGNADFAMSDGASLIQARAAGKPVVAIASIMQRSPQAVISLKETGIQRPQDLAGHTVSVASGGATTTFIALLNSQNIDSETLTIVERTEFGIEPLLSGQVDALVGWIINEGVAVQEQGLEPQYILLSDYGVDNYNFVLFTTETMIAEQPDVVQRVVDSIRAGLQDVVSNPAASIAHTLTFNSELVEAEQLRRLEASVPLINVPGQSLGGMDTRVWQFTHDTLIEQNLLTESVNLEEVYTLDFVANESQ